MNFLFVTTDDILRNASSNIRNAALISGLVANGNDVTIISICHGHTIDDALKEAIKGSRLIYANKEFRNHHGEVGKGFSLKFFLKRMLLKIYNKFRIYDPYVYRIPKDFSFLKGLSYDVLISSSDPRSSHLFAKKILQRNKKHVTWIQYWGDPMANDISSSKLMGLFLKKAEKRILSYADLIVYTNQATVNLLSDIYNLPKSKILSIPTSYYIGNVKKKNVTQIVPGTIKVGYFGEYYSAKRNMKPIVQSIMRMNDFSLYLIGNTDCDYSGNEKIIQYPKMSAKQVEQFQDEMDILLVVENIPVEGKECIQIPGKMYHYGLSDKKVLVISESGLIKKEFDKYGRYLFCDNDTNQIENALLSLYKNDSSSMSKPLDEFSPRRVAGLLTERIESYGSKCEK